MRLGDKSGDSSDALSEVEYHRANGGASEEGRGAHRRESVAEAFRRLRFECPASAYRSGRWLAADLILVPVRAVEQGEDIVRGFDRQPVRCCSLPGRNIFGHVAHKLFLILGRTGKQRHHKILQRNQAHANISVFSVADLTGNRRLFRFAAPTL